MSGEISPDGEETFYDPYRSPDYTFWCRSPFWNAEELTYLSLGFDPWLLPELSLDERLAEPEIWQAISRRYFLISRHIEANQLSEKIGPLEGLRFLEGIGEEVVGPLIDYLEEFADQRTNLAALCNVQAHALSEMHRQIRVLTSKLEASESDRPQEMSGLKKKLHKVQGILAGVAVAQYNYRPSALRNKAPSQIVEDCQFVGLSVSDDTVRLHLREGAEQLDPLPDFGDG